MLTREDSDPLYLQVKKELQKRIRTGAYAPASRLPSQIMLTKTFGVSQITVQRALQELEEEGLLVARPGSGTYVVDRQQLATTRSQLQTIGVVFQDIVGGYPLIKPLLRAIREACHGLGYGLQMLEVAHSPESVQDGVDAPSFSGAILTSPVSISWLHWLQQHQVPYVLLHNDVVDGVSHNVSCNYALGVMQATAHLFEQGCKRLALVTAEETRYSAGQMALGFQLAHTAAGRPVEPKQIISSRYTQSAGFDVVQRWVDTDTLPDGVIFASNELASGGLQALDRLSIRVPDQVAVVGFGGRESAPPEHAGLSTIDAHNERTGQVAIQLLQQLIEGTQPPAHRILIDPELIVADSSCRAEDGSK